jgi:MFS family permease
VLIAGILLGLLVGLLLGGRLSHLLEIRLRWAPAILFSVVLRFGTELALREGLPFAEQLRLPLFALSFGILFAALWLNRDHSGLLIAATGVLANGLAIVANGGWMPVWGPALALAGFGPEDLVATFHRLLPPSIGLEFLLRAGPFGDLVPIPIPFIRNVASIGDLFLSAGLGWFVFSTLVRGQAQAREMPEAPLTVGPRASAAILGIHAETGLPVSDSGAQLARPILLGGTPAGPLLPPLGQGEGPGIAPIVVRIRQHPYMRLALDARFSAFWLGQTISLFGDRLHQIALGVLVLGASGSPLLTGLVFLAATLPNLLLAPIAGTLVDRWDHKTVLVVSDLLRAGLVLLLPVAALQNLALVYPIVFLITSVSIFFRPAKAAVVPRIVRRSDLMAANSATWMSDTMADLVGYPLAGLFVALLGAQLPLAFWADSATYVASAVLIIGLEIPPVARHATERVGTAVRDFVAELREGWRFLRGHPALFQNTLISAVAQTTVGATLALAVVYSQEWLDGTIIEYPRNWAALETAIGLGNLAGGIAVGAVGAQMRKGWLVVGGFLVMGLATMVLGLTGNILVALAAALVVGAANLIYLVPTQTLFAEVTPPEMMGRVVSFRSAFVFGSLTGAMGLSAVLAEWLPVGPVIAGFGLVTFISGLVAAALPAVRES